MQQLGTKEFKKINFCSQDDIRDGDYLNISVDVLDNSLEDNLICSDIVCLNSVVKDNSVEEIVALRTLSHVSLENMLKALVNWREKLVDNGLLKIAIDDMFVLSGELLQNKISIADLSKMVFRDHNCKSIMDSTSLLFLLDKVGFKVENKRFDGYSFYVEARKIDNAN